jgi:hypothetical protein
MTVSPPTKYTNSSVVEITDYTHVFEQLITYPALGLCAPGEAHKLVERGDNTVRKSAKSFARL